MKIYELISEAAPILSGAVAAWAGWLNQRITKMEEECGKIKTKIEVLETKHNIESEVAGENFERITKMLERMDDKLTKALTRRDL